MKTLALGQVETIGLPPAIAAADAAVKSADVQLIGYELAKGGGKVTIKVVGQVGAVRAAVSAAKAAATRIGMVASSSIIARPSDQILKLIHSQETVGVDATEAVEVSVASPVDGPVDDLAVAETVGADTAGAVEDSLASPAEGSVDVSAVEHGEAMEKRTNEGEET